ncbi:hypothetical protein ACSQ67_004451 [Phaseolus vulgaris]
MRTAAKIAGMGFSRMGLWGFSGGAPGLIVPKRVATLVDRWRVIAGSEDRRVPKHVSQPFHLLSTSREVQAVVASLACDPNVWNAAMENPAVSSFFQYHNRQSRSRYVFSNFVSRLRNLELTGIELVSRMRKSGAEADGNTKNKFHG